MSKNQPKIQYHSLRLVQYTKWKGILSWTSLNNNKKCMSCHYLLRLMNNFFCSNVSNWITINRRDLSCNSNESEFYCANILLIIWSDKMARCHGKWHKRHLQMLKGLPTLELRPVLVLTYKNKWFTLRALIAYGHEYKAQF